MRLHRSWIARTAGLALACLAAGAGPALADEKPEPDVKLDEPQWIWQDDASPAGLPTKLRSKKYGLDLTFYGFLEATVAYNQSRMDSIVVPRFVVQETAAFHGQGHWRIHARHTRFGVKLGGDPIANFLNLKPEGKFEIDFLGGGSESRNLIRMRKAYIKFTGDLGDGNWWSFLIGQDSDTYSPLFPSVNYDMLMWGSGNTGDRRPQVRGEYNWSGGSFDLLFQGAAGLTNAVVGQDADANGQVDGEAADYPMLQGRAALKLPMGEKDGLTVGLWGVRSWYKTDSVVIKSDKRQNSWLLGLDLHLQMGALYVKGEVFQGGNMADYRGGMFLAYDGNGDPVKGMGGWIEGGYALNDWLTALAGYGIDDPDNEDTRTLGAGTFTDNQAVWGGAVLNFSPAKIGFEVIHWQTRRVASNISNAVRYRIYFRLYF